MRLNLQLIQRAQSVPYTREFQGVEVGDLTGKYNFFIKLKLENKFFNFISFVVLTSLLYIRICIDSKAMPSSRMTALGG